MKNILIGMAIGVVVAVGIMCFYNFNQKCASNNIEFAERVASRIIDDLGDRTWFVTDGTLDKYLLRVAAERNKELNLICLNLDHDKDYVDALRQLVHHKKPGGNKNGELLLSLDSGVLSFIRHWLLTDSQIAKKLAIFGVPDLWCSAGIDPVPESFFFGGDPSRKVDMSLWKDFKGLLFEPKEWGSNSLGNKDDSVEYLRFQIRRHLGFVANNKGVYLQKAGNDGDAYKMYDLVLSEIDSDNISALINIFEMISRKHPSTVIRKKRNIEQDKAST